MKSRRKQILDLFQDDKNVTFEAGEIAANFPDVGKSAIYQMLSAMVKSGLLRRGFVRGTYGLPIESSTPPTSTFFAIYDPTRCEYGQLYTRPQFEERMKQELPSDRFQIHIFTLYRRKKIKLVRAYELEDLS